MSAAALSVLATAAFAQSPSDQPVEEMVVTAQKREQSVQDVPIALTAYDGQTLETLGIQEFEELSLFVPGFEVQNQSPNNPGFVMRGITSDSGEAFNEPRVSVFQDGVSISKSRGSYVELFDLERVEVAKGPQSTLFGRGALIGGVNLIQNKAQLDTFDVQGKITAGNFDLRAIEGVVNVPIGDKAALRGALRAKKRDGYVENLVGGDDFNSTETEAYRVALRLAPTDRLTIDVIGNYQNDNPSGTSFRSGSLIQADPLTGTPLAGLEPWDGAALAASPSFGKPLGLDREVWGGTIIAGYEMTPALTLTSISAFRRFDSDETFDADGLGLDILTFAEQAKGDQWSQELRLNYDNGGRITGFLGANWFKETGSQTVPSAIDERLTLATFAGALDGNPFVASTLPASSLLLTNPAFTAPLLQGLAGAFGYLLPGGTAAGIAANLKGPHQERFVNVGETEAYDFYGDVTFKVTERFDLTAGVRYTMEDKSSGIGASTLNGRSIFGGFLGALSLPEPLRTQLLTALAVPGAATIPESLFFPVPNFGLVAQPTAGNGQIVTTDYEDDAFTWRFVGRYELHDNASVYASYARGRRPDVLSPSAPDVPFGPPEFTLADAEVVDSYEIGAKAVLPDQRLSLDGAVYYYDYENFQTTIQQGAQLIVTNAGKARAIGFEGQVAWSPLSFADIYMTYAYSHARFKAGLFDGNRFRLSPDHSLSLGATLRAPLGNGMLDFTPSFTWQSQVFFDNDNDIPALQIDNIVPDAAQDELQDAYGLLNLRLGYQPTDGFWRVEAFVENVLDEEYIKDAGNTGDAFGLPTFIAGEPRFFGMSLILRK